MLTQAAQEGTTSVCLEEVTVFLHLIAASQTKQRLFWGDHFDVLITATQGLFSVCALV